MIAIRSQLVVEEGSVGTELYILISGELEVTKQVCAGLPIVWCVAAVTAACAKYVGRPLSCAHVRCREND
eukprot:COSAG01_NODE_51315_length_355_cov_3.351562_1_plen_70_part_00